MRYFSFIAVVLTATSVLSKDYNTNYKTVSASAPIRNADPGVMGAQWLDAIALTDYEVWVAKDTSKTTVYEVWLETRYGWSPSGEASGGTQIQQLTFDSLEAAELFAELQMLTNDNNLSYRIRAFVPDMDWELVDTFDSRAEARQFLSHLLQIIGDDYVGDIRSVTVVPAALVGR